MLLPAYGFDNTWTIRATVLTLAILALAAALLANIRKLSAAWATPLPRCLRDRGG